MYSSVSLCLPFVFKQWKKLSIRDAWGKNPFTDTNMFDGILSVGESKVLGFCSVCGGWFYGVWFWFGFGCGFFVCVLELKETKLKQ